MVLYGSKSEGHNGELYQKLSPAHERGALAPRWMSNTLRTPTGGLTPPARALHSLYFASPTLDLARGGVFFVFLLGIITGSIGYPKPLTESGES